MKTDLKSSVAKVGTSVTQIITFKGGVKKTIKGIKTQTITQGQFTKFYTDEKMVMVNDNNVLLIEVFKEK